MSCMCLIDLALALGQIVPPGDENAVSKDVGSSRVNALTEVIHVFHEAEQGSRFDFAR
jgi:hypothetical protein